MPKKPAAIHYCYVFEGKLNRHTQCKADPAGLQTTDKWPAVTCRKCQMDAPFSVPLKLNTSNITLLQAYYLTLIGRYGLHEYKFIGSSYVMRDLKIFKAKHSNIDSMDVPTDVAHAFIRAGLIEKVAGGDWRSDNWVISKKGKALKAGEVLFNLREKANKPAAQQARALALMLQPKVHASVYSGFAVYIKRSVNGSFIGDHLMTVKGPSTVSLLASGWVEIKPDADGFNRLALTPAGRKVAEAAAAKISKAK